MNFEELITEALCKAGNNKAQQYEVLLRDQNKRKYLIGKNEQSAELIDKYEISGLIDDFNLDTQSWHGVPIVATKDIDRDSVVINCATSISPVQARSNLEAAGLRNIVSISDLISEGGKTIDMPWFVRQQREEMLIHKEWWNKLYNQLADDKSKQTLVDVTRFRLTADSEYMKGYSVRLLDQYFEDFMAYQKEIFVDAGGFDGDTAEEFINRYPDYKKIYLFEPSHKNLTAAKRRLSGKRDIVYKSVGLSDAEGKLYFNANAGSASSVLQGEGELISVVTLDNELINEPITFIKMDLEGWEMNALRGATETIRKNKPKLAIAVYHAAKDFREIPQFILGIHPNYRVFLRHYTQGWSETVMFFL